MNETKLKQTIEIIDSPKGRDVRWIFMPWRLMLTRNPRPELSQTDVGRGDHAGYLMGSVPRQDDWRGAGYQSRLASSQALSSKPSAAASAGVSFGGRARILRAAIWSPGRLQDSTAINCSFRKHSTENCWVSAEPRLRVLS